MTTSLHRHHKSQGSEHPKRWVFRRLQKMAEMAWTRYKTANRSRYEQRWSEQLDRRPLTAVYGGQAVMTSTLIVGGISSRGPRAGAVSNS